MSERRAATARPFRLSGPSGRTQMRALEIHTTSLSVKDPGSTEPELYRGAGRVPHTMVLPAERVVAVGELLTWLDEHISLDPALTLEDLKNRLRSAT